MVAVLLIGIPTAGLLAAFLLVQHDRRRNAARLWALDHPHLSKPNHLWGSPRMSTVQDAKYVIYNEYGPVHLLCPNEENTRCGRSNVDSQRITWAQAKVHLAGNWCHGCFHGEKM